MINAVIFDKDGVLMLTEDIYYQAHLSTLDYFGVDGKKYTWKMHAQRSGTPTSERFLFLKNKFDLKMSFNKYYLQYKKRYLENMTERGLIVPDGVFNLLNYFKKVKMPIAVATGGVRENASLTLEKTNLIDFFDVVVTSSDVAKGKPDPETFLLAASRLGVNPKDCVVIGDSVNDVLGAKAAGMKMIAITDKSYSENPALALPDVEVKEFKEITIDMIKSL